MDRDNELCTGVGNNATTNRTTTTTTTTRAPKRGPNVLTKFALLNLILLAVEFGNRNLPVVYGDDGESAIELTRFQVPTQAKPGELRRLSCQFKLHGATLHAVKLFKDEQEFFRFTPGHQKMSFPVPGANVDLGRSRENEVWLKINKRSAGLYKCQVLIEGTFKSVSLARRMEVVQAGDQGLAPAPAPTASSQGASQGGPWQHYPVQQLHEPSQRHPHLSRQAHSPVQQYPSHLYGAGSGASGHGLSISLPGALIWSLFGLVAAAMGTTTR